MKQLQSNNNSQEMECLRCEGCGLFRGAVCFACNGHGIVLVDSQGKPHTYESTIEQHRAKLILEGKDA